MQGYLQQSRQRPLYKGPDSTISITTVNTGSVSAFSNRELTALESVSSYRSHIAKDRLGPSDILMPDDISDYGRMLGDIGHEFDHEYTRVYTSAVDFRYSGNNISYKGLLLPQPSAAGTFPAGDKGNYLSAPKRSEAALVTDGALLIQRANPLRSQANLFGAVMEIVKDGVPEMLFHNFSKVASSKKAEITRSLSKDYLNYMFAVSPTINDIKKLVEAAFKVDKLARQLNRDSGRDIYRKRSLLDTVDVYGKFPGGNSRLLFYKPSSIGNPNQSFMDPWLDSFSPLSGSEHIITDTRKTWFEGSFHYYLSQIFMPEEVSAFFKKVLSAKNLKQMNQIFAEAYLLGATPANLSWSLLWQLTPYSWLVDWFVNLGTVIDNYETFNRLGLVMNYGYLMCEETRSYASNYIRKDGSSFSAQHVHTRQRRRRANPFGFGIKDSGLSPIQLSLLGALAASRGR